jgi:signal transduction histidine kinase
MSRFGAADSPSARRVDAALLLLTITLAVFTGLLIAVPWIAPAAVSDRLDLAITTSATLVAGAVAALEWARGRVTRDGASLVRASAFGVLTVLNAVTLAVLLLGVEEGVGASLDAPGQLPIVAGVVARATCAALLVAAGFPAVRSAGPRLHPLLLGLGPAVLVLGLLALGVALGEGLPLIVDPSVLERLAREPTAILTPGSAPILVISQTAIGLAFLAAAVLAHRAYRVSGRIGEALFAAGFLIAAFSQVHGALHPGSYASLTTTGDMLRLAFYGVLLAAIVIDRRDDLRELQAANVEIRRLADAEVASAALQERARLAREIHDGLAQDLWYAKLKQSRLGARAELDGEARQLSDEVATAIDAALAEARHAVTAMREDAGTGPIVEVLQRQVADFSDRFALEAELSVEGPNPSIAPRTAAEVVRIVQEALTNARRHADATVVRVLVTTTDEMRVVVADNGRGFRPDVAPGGFGLDSMRQRAALVGGDLSVSSEPANGTQVTLRVPLDRVEEAGDG